MDTIDTTVTDPTDATEQPLRIRVTDSAQELLALQALVRQTIPMLERPETYCTGKRLQLARELQMALRCTAEPAGGEALQLPGANAAPDEEYCTGYWTEEEER